MLRSISIVFSFFILLALSCDEIPPTLNPNTSGPNIDVPVEDQKRQVLIEEFTGVRCVNCPAGSEIIQQLRNSYGQQLVPVSIHSGFYAIPYPESNQDLATSIGSQIESLVGEALGYPTGVINRIKFSGEEQRQLSKDSWAGYIAEEIIGEPTVKIDLQPSFNETNRELTVEVDLYIEENITADDIRLSLLITENNIIDLQLTPDGIQNDYVHKHVFRDVISSFNGDILSENLIAGSVVSRSFTYTLPDTWVATECHIVGFIHQSGDIQKVLQAHEVAVVE